MNKSVIKTRILPKASENAVVETPPVVASQPEKKVVEQQPSDSKPDQIVDGRSYKAVDWDKVIQRIETVDDYTLLHDQMSIPPELKRLEEAGFYCYRWLDEKSDRFHEQLDAHIPWEIVNRNNSPEVPERYFDTSGAIKKGNNMILARMHRKAHDLRQELIWRASEPPKRTGPVKDGMSFEDNPVRGSDIVIAAETEAGRFTELNQRAGSDHDIDA